MHKRSRDATVMRTASPEPNKAGADERFGMTLARPNPFTARLQRPLYERLPAALPGLLLAALLATAILVFQNPQVLRGELVDTDSYLHVVRLRSLLADGGWHGDLFLRDNAPFGLVLHWTKAYDLIFLALAAPVAALAGWNTALAIVAPAVGPLATCALILAGAWAAAPVCRVTEQRLIGVVVALTPIVLLNGSVGDADHHVMVVAAWVLLMGFALRVATGGGPRQGVWAGLSGALALWISVECILGVLLGIAFMGLAWVRAGGRLRRASLAFAAAFAVGMAALLAFDPPYGGWLQAEPGRLSILYVTYAGLLALVWTALTLAPQSPRAWRTRLAVASAGAALSALCLTVLFPGVLAPEHAVYGSDDELRLWDEVNEMRPAFQNPAAGMLLIGGPAIGLAVALALAWRGRRRADGAAWAIFALMLALLNALGLYHGRFVIYPEVLAALPIAVLLARVGPFVDHVAPIRLRLVARAVAVVAILFGPLITAASVVPAARGGSADEFHYCAVSPVASALNDPRFMGGADLIIMTQPVAAAEVLYWTWHRVVDAPFHTNVEGIYGITHDLVQFMTSRNDAAAREVVARRGIAFVMLCPGDRTGTDAVDPDGRELYTRLLNGEVPGWLVPQPWPAGIASDFRLFRVLSLGGQNNRRGPTARGNSDLPSRLPSRLAIVPQPSRGDGIIAVPIY